MCKLCNISQSWLMAKDQLGLATSLQRQRLATSTWKRLDTGTGHLALQWPHWICKNLHIPHTHHWYHAIWWNDVNSRKYTKIQTNFSSRPDPDGFSWHMAAMALPWLCHGSPWIPTRLSLSSLITSRRSQPCCSSWSWYHVIGGNLLGLRREIPVDPSGSNLTGQWSSGHPWSEKRLGHWMSLVFKAAMRCLDFAPKSLQANFVWICCRLTRHDLHPNHPNLNNQIVYNW